MEIFRVAEPRIPNRHLLNPANRSGRPPGPCLRGGGKRSGTPRLFRRERTVRDPGDDGRRSLKSLCPPFWVKPPAAVLAFFRAPSADSAGWSGREKMSGTGKARHSDDRRPMSKSLSGREKMGQLKRPPSGKKRTPAGINPAILPALPPPAAGRSAGSGCRDLRRFPGGFVGCP